MNHIVIITIQCKGCVHTVVTLCSYSWLCVNCMNTLWWLLVCVLSGRACTLYGWWLLEEGTSRNVPIAGFEMILREDYKSRDEVEGLIFFPKYYFKPQDTGNIPWCSRQQSRHLLYCMLTHCPHCLARLRHSSQKFTKLSIFSAGISFKLCAVQCVYIVLCAAVQRVSIVLCAQ